MGIYGFSWTTLFFGPIPAFFRGDIATAVMLAAGSTFSFWLSSIIWAFIYNKKYTIALLERGYLFDAPQTEIDKAKRKLGIR